MLGKVGREEEERSRLREPTEKELCECIMMVRERFPECGLDRVIYLLHTVLLKGAEDTNANTINNTDKGFFLSRTRSRSREPHRNSSSEHS